MYLENQECQALETLNLESWRDIKKSVLFRLILQVMLMTLHVGHRYLGDLSETGGRHRFLAWSSRIFVGHVKFQVAEKFIKNTNANSFMEGIRDVGRRIFIDVYTHYKFSKEFGLHPKAENLLDQSFDGLNQMLRCEDVKTLLSDVLRELFRQSLLWEQEMTVTSGVFEEFEKLGNAAFRSIAKKPIVNFAFFPSCVSLV